MRAPIITEKMQGDGLSEWETREICVKDPPFRAKGDGITDDTTAIQNAINVVRDAGGGVVWMPDGTYRIIAALILYDGVRLLGAGDSYNGAGGTTGKGTVLKVTGDAPGIIVNGATGYGFEIAYMHILGNGGASQDGIYLVKSDSSVPRSSHIHDISIKSVGRDGVRFDGFSYVTLSRVAVITAGGNGFNIIASASMQEYLYFEDCRANGCTGNGFQLSDGHFIHLRNCDAALNVVGLHISGPIYVVTTKNLSVSQNTSYGIEVHADSSNIGRLSFRDTFITMAGSNAAEKAIYTHRDDTHILQFIYFDFVDISKIGGTSPTTAIDIDTMFLDGELINIRNASGGAISLPTDMGLRYTDAEKLGIQALDDTGTPSVQGGEKYITGGNTAITDFDDGYVGQVIIIIANHALTITDGTNIFLNGSANFDMNPIDTLTLICRFDNKWYELSRSDNT